MTTCCDRTLPLEKPVVEAAIRYAKIARYKYKRCKEDNPDAFELYESLENDATDDIRRLNDYLDLLAGEPKS